MPSSATVRMPSDVVPTISPRRRRSASIRASRRPFSKLRPASRASAASASSSPLGRPATPVRSRTTRQPDASPSTRTGAPTAVPLLGEQSTELAAAGVAAHRRGVLEQGRPQRRQLGRRAGGLSAVADGSVHDDLGSGADDEHRRGCVEAPQHLGEEVGHRLHRVDRTGQGLGSPVQRAEVLAVLLRERVPAVGGVEQHQRHREEQHRRRGGGEGQHVQQPERCAAGEAADPAGGDDRAEIAEHVGHPPAARHDEDRGEGEVVGRPHGDEAEPDTDEPARGQAFAGRPART